MKAIVKIEKLVHGGQGLVRLEDGRVVFLWGVLPGEEVEMETILEKKSYIEAAPRKIVKASKDRVDPKEENYIDTSPWQIIGIDAENKIKTEIVRELYARAHVDIPKVQKAVFVGDEYGYRNGYVFRFCLDDNGDLSLATVERKSNTLVPVQGSVLARPEINQAALALLEQLQSLHIKATTLSTLELRCDQSGSVVAALVVRQKQMPKLKLAPGMLGLKVSFRGRNTKTEHLYTLGNVELSDSLLGKSFHYGVDSFFQVNVPVYEKVLKKMKTLAMNEIVDMYSGVGVIGLSLAKGKVTLVESNISSAAYAKINLQASGLAGDAVRVQSERALEFIDKAKTIVFDPPRDGLDKKIIERLLEVKPAQILYLSCDPATQARDIAKLSQFYEIGHMSVYNFFPHTPHIETLVALKKK